MVIEIVTAWFHKEEKPYRKCSRVTHQPGALQMRVYLSEVSVYDAAQVQMRPQQYSNNGDYHNHPEILQNPKKSVQS